jgi:quercetin dioxygenase-like cupin family protein
VLRVTIDGEARRLRTGDEIVIPAGSVHSLASAGGASRIVTGLRAVRR